MFIAALIRRKYCRIASAPGDRRSVCRLRTNCIIAGSAGPQLRSREFLLAHGTATSRASKYHLGDDRRQQHAEHGTEPVQRRHRENHRWGPEQGRSRPLPPTRRPHSPSRRHGASRRIPRATFLIADSTWQFGASSNASPVSFAVPNREGVTVHVSGRAANVLDEECAYALSPLTRWTILGSTGQALDTDVSGQPVFGLYPIGAGSVEVLGIAFAELGQYAIHQRRHFDAGILG